MKYDRRIEEHQQRPMSGRKVVNNEASKSNAGMDPLIDMEEQPPKVPG